MYISQIDRLQYESQKHIRRIAVRSLLKKSISLRALSLAIQLNSTFNNKHDTNDRKIKLLTKLKNNIRKTSKMGYLAQKILTQLNQIKKLSKTDLQFQIRQQIQENSSQCYTEKQSKQILISDLIQNVSEPEIYCNGIFDESNSGFYFQNDQNQDQDEGSMLDEQEYSEVPSNNIIVKKQQIDQKKLNKKIFKRNK